MSASVRVSAAAGGIARPVTSATAAPRRRKFLRNIVCPVPPPRRRPHAGSTVVRPVSEFKRFHPFEPRKHGSRGVEDTPPGHAFLRPESEAALPVEGAFGEDGADPTADLDLVGDRFRELADATLDKDDI